MLCRKKLKFWCSNQLIIKRKNLNILKYVIKVVSLVLITCEKFCTNTSFKYSEQFR